jgi:ketohexokinase
VGAGDTFIAGTLYGLLCHDSIEKGPSEHWNDQRKLSFAVALATLKVQQEGFDGLGAAAASITAHQQ